MADESCEDRELLLTMFRDILEETGVRLYDAADGHGVRGGATVPALLFPSPARGQYVWDLAPGPSAISLAISMLVNGCTVVQGNVLGLDCEEEPALGVLRLLCLLVPVRVCRAQLCGRVECSFTRAR